MPISRENIAQKLQALKAKQAGLQAEPSSSALPIAVKSKKTPFWKNENLQTASLLTGIGLASIVGIKKINDRLDTINQEKKRKPEIKVDVKKENNAPGVIVSGDTNMSELAQQKQREAEMLDMATKAGKIDPGDPVAPVSPETNVMKSSALKVTLEPDNIPVNVEARKAEQVKRLNELAQLEADKEKVARLQAELKRKLAEPPTTEERLREIARKLKVREERKPGEPRLPKDIITGEDQDFWNNNAK